MKLRNKIVFIILLSQQVRILSGQEVWNLTQCITFSLENNITLKNAEIDQKIQKIEYSQAKLNQLPQVDAGLSLNESFGRAVDPATNTYSNVSYLSNSYNVTSSVVLFSGFAQRNRIAFERYNLRVENNRVEQQKNLVIYNVIDAYFNLILKKGLYTLYLDNLKLMEEQCFSIQKYINVGRKAESDIYEFNAKFATDSFLLVQQSGNVEKAILSLKASMNYPFADSLTIDTSDYSFTISDSLNAQYIVESAKIQLPDLRITENQLLAAKKYVAQMRGSFSPRLNLYAGWNTEYYETSNNEATAFDEQFKNNTGEYVGISLSIPIFSKFNKINTLRTASLEYKKAENEHLENILKFEEEINEVYIDWQTAKNEYMAAQKQFEKSEIAYKTAEKKLTIGQINITDFYIQKNELLKAKTELLRTNLQLALKDIYIQFILTGKWLNI